MSITLGFILTLFLAVATFDVWVIFKRGKRESISAYIIRGSKNYPLVVLLFGIVLGHLFWSMKTEDIYNVKCEEVSK